ncbi:ribonuclease [Mycena pura]|uniref:Ribonuclease T2-like n=1 Tax=Mycena pura TaxID=153505 RepID=A0AAD6USR0_9AGAR|nr:ribonuclease [Mycena pura]
MLAVLLAAFASPAAAYVLSGRSPFGVTSLTERALMPDIASGCPPGSPLSCGTSSGNTCCFETPGGLLLQTQFWDSSPSTGPTNSWTIHGLWPDNCDGTFSENCDSSRDYTGISSLLTSQGASSTLALMNTYWKNDPDDGSDEELWEHEWATHGTCYSTLQTKCLPSGSPKGAEAVAFFQTTVKLFQTLPTYTFLQNQGITPSSSATHTLASLQAAVRAEWGFTPTFDCDGSNLNGAAYYFHLQGSIIDGNFVPIDAPESSTCPASGIKYPLKSGSPVTTTSTAGGGGSTGVRLPPLRGGGDGTLPAKATIHASSAGGLLSLGTWSTQTLATYTLSGTASSFTMTSSKGACGVSGGAFSCGSGVTSTTFSAVSSGSELLLASGGSTAWTSDGVPSGQTVYPVFTGAGHAQDYTLSIIST